MEMNIDLAQEIIGNIIACGSIGFELDAWDFIKERLTTPPPAPTESEAVELLSELYGALFKSGHQEFYEIFQTRYKQFRANTQTEEE